MSARMPTFAEMSSAELQERLAHYLRVVDTQQGLSKETVRRLRATIARLESVITEKKIGQEVQS